MTVDDEDSFAQARAHERVGRLREARAGYARLLTQQPNHADALHRLGVMALRANRPVVAAALLRRAVGARPEAAKFHHRLGRALQALGQLEEALAAYRAAVNLDPSFAPAYVRLGGLCAKRRDFDAAIDTFAAAVRLQSTSVEALAGLASALGQVGRWPAALEHLRRAVSLAPLHAGLHGNLIINLHYHSAIAADSIRAEQALWNDRHVVPLRHLRQPHRNRREPARRLRVGYVSPNLAHHAAAPFILPILEEHDRTEVEVHCYSGVQRPDEVTARIRGSGVVWHEVATLSDAALAEKIRTDEIDILIDAAMHWSGGRVLTFALRPAPVQVSWLVFIDDAGLDCYDCRLSDRWLDPVSSEAEQPAHVVRLPDAWSCFRPVEPFPEIEPPPCQTTGQVTFGSLNKFAKVNEAVLHCWSRVMRTVPDSTLTLACPQGSAREKVQQTMAALGVTPSRLAFAGELSRPEYHRLHRQIDIALDPFPYNGCTTTCDALWLGVPVVTLAGSSLVARAGASILANAGFSELIAHDEDEYVRIASDLAQDVPRLAALRATMRPRMAASPLMDAPQLVRAVESEYRKMWRRWCTAS